VFVALVRLPPFGKLKGNAMPDAKNKESVARAEELRKEIDELRRGGPAQERSGEDVSSPPAKVPKSPREFVHQRMRELDQQKNGS
jgi:hypothetical protein